MNTSHIINISYTHQLRTSKQVQQASTTSKYNKQAQQAIATITTKLSQQSCHNKAVTTKLSQPNYHNQTITTIPTQSHQHNHTNTITPTQSNITTTITTKQS